MAKKTMADKSGLTTRTKGMGFTWYRSRHSLMVSPKQKQIIRIIKTDTNLPKERESLFWLNVQEIPPKPEAKDGDGSMLAIAMNNRVKLIYRPTAIKDSRQDAEKQLKLEQRGCYKR